MLFVTPAGSGIWVDVFIWTDGQNIDPSSTGTLNIAE